MRYLNRITPAPHPSPPPTSPVKSPSPLVLPVVIISSSHPLISLQLRHSASGLLSLSLSLSRLGDAASDPLARRSDLPYQQDRGTVTARRWRRLRRWWRPPPPCPAPRRTWQFLPPPPRRGSSPLRPPWSTPNIFYLGCRLGNLNGEEWHSRQHSWSPRRERETAAATTGMGIPERVRRTGGKRRRMERGTRTPTTVAATRRHPKRMERGQKLTRKREMMMTTTTMTTTVTMMMMTRTTTMTTAMRMRKRWVKRKRMKIPKKRRTMRMKRPCNRRRRGRSESKTMSFGQRSSVALRTAPDQ